MNHILLPYWVYLASRRALIGLPCLFIGLSARGISDLEIGIGLAALALSQVGFEVPSGVASDRLGRRLTLVISGFLRTVAWLLFATAYSAEWLIAAFACMGAAFAFDSGTDSAWLFDSLKDSGKESQYTEQEARGHTIGLVSMGIATLLGGWLMIISTDLAIYCTVVPMVVSMASAVLLVEPRQSKSSSDAVFWSEVRTGLHVIWREKFVFQVVVLSALGIAIIEVYFRFIQQLFVGQLSVAPLAMGYVYAIWLMVSALASRSVPYLLSKTRVIVVTRWLVVALGTSLLWLGGSHAWSAIILTVVPQLCTGMLPVLLRTEVNNSIESTARATILSTFGFLTAGIIFVLAPVLGIVSDLIGHGSMMVCLGVVLLSSSVSAHILFEAKRWRERPRFMASLWG